MRRALISIALATIACKEHERREGPVPYVEMAATTVAKMPAPTPSVIPSSVFWSSYPTWTCAPPWTAFSMHDGILADAATTGVVMEDICCPATAKAGGPAEFDSRAATRLFGSVQSDCKQPPGSPVGTFEIVFLGSGAVADVDIHGYSPAATTCLRTKMLVGRVPPFSLPCRHEIDRLDLTL